MKELSQWDIPNRTNVMISKKEFARFLRMDGMYGQWLSKDGKIFEGNYDKIYEDNSVYALNKDFLIKKKK